MVLKRQIAQDSDIPEIPAIFMGFFIRQGIPEKPENVMGIFYSNVDKKSLF